MFNLEDIVTLIVFKAFDVVSVEVLNEGHEGFVLDFRDLKHEVLWVVNAPPQPFSFFAFPRIIPYLFFKTPTSRQENASMCMEWFTFYNECYICS